MKKKILIAVTAVALVSGALAKGFINADHFLIGDRGDVGIKRLAAASLMVTDGGETNAGGIEATTTPGEYNLAGTRQTGVKEVYGLVTLTAGAATATMPFAFTSTASFSCQATDQTAIAATRAVPASTTTVTVGGTGTDVISIACRGN
jgi:hypothetical protein